MRTRELSSPTEEIAGLVERITYFNEESGFCVLRVKVRGHRDEVTVLGAVPSINAGEWLTGNGCWVRDKEHGLQFKARILKATPPTTSEGVERYLGGGFLTSPIGDYRARSEKDDSSNVGNLGDKYDLVLPDNRELRCTVTGIADRAKQRLSGE